MQHFLKSSLALTALLLAASAASAGTTTTINFNGLTGNQGPFTTYTEGGYTVTKTSGDLYVETSGFGDPVPDIFSDSGKSTAAVTDGGSLFTFDSVDLANYAGDLSRGNYEIIGLDNGVEVFDYSGLIEEFGVFNTYSNAFSADEITRLSITVDNGDSVNIDNIVVGNASVAATPEPSSLVLLGTGLIGAAGAARRRFTRN